MASDDNAHVSFSNDVDIEEATPAKSGRDGPELSQSAKAWDINCDGELDDTEKALKDLDKTGKGTLSKDQMYQLMHENRAVQKELGRMKKWVIGLVVFTALLALANVGMSFAAAFLAKDTSTEEGKLVDKSGETVKTDSTTEIFMVDNDLQNLVTRERRLQCLQGSSLCNVGQTPWGSIDKQDARKIANKCNSRESVTVGKELQLPNGNWKTITHQICPVADVAVEQLGQGNVKMTITRDGKPDITLEPSSEVNNVYVMDGLGEAGDSCMEINHDIDNDCGVHMKCEKANVSDDYGVCVASVGHSCATTDDCGSDLVCEENICKGLYLHNCDAANDCSSSLTCNGDECVGAVALGSACDDSSPCDSNLKCEYGFCVRSIGYQCTGTFQGNCGSNLQCEDDGSGSSICLGDDGHICDSDTDCKSLSKCDNGFCAKDIGHECYGIDQCGSFLQCDHPGICARGEGHQCSADSDCGSNLACEGGVCKGLYLHSCEVTGLCSGTLACGSHKVLSQKLGNVCVGIIGYGDTCNDSNPCATNLKCEEGSCVGDIGYDCAAGTSVCGNNLECDGTSSLCAGLQGAYCNDAKSDCKSGLSLQCFTSNNFLATSGECACTPDTCSGEDEVCRSTNECGTCVPDLAPSCRSKSLSDATCGPQRRMEVIPEIATVIQIACDIDATLPEGHVGNDSEDCYSACTCTANTDCKNFNPADEFTEICDNGHCVSSGGGIV